MTALVLLVMIGVRAIFIGVTQVAAAIELRRVIDNEWLLASSGLLSVAFGVLVLAFPGAGALAVLWMIGAYAVVLGVVLVALGFRLHRLVGTWTREHA